MGHIDRAHPFTVTFTVTCDRPTLQEDTQTYDASVVEIGESPALVDGKTKSMRGYLRGRTWSEEMAAELVEGCQAGPFCRVCFP